MQASSQKLLTATGNLHRKLDIKQRSADHGEASPSGYLYITAPVSIAQRTWQHYGRGGRKKSRKSAVKQSLLEMAKQDQKIAVSMDTLMWKGFHLLTSGKSLFRDEPPNWLSDAEWSAKMDSSGSIYLCIHTCIYMQQI